MEQAIIEILKGVPVAAVLFYFAIQFRKDNDKSQSRYENLVDRTLEEFNKQGRDIAVITSEAVTVMREVAKKLDATK